MAFPQNNSLEEKIILISWSSISFTINKHTLVEGVAVSCNTEASIDNSPAYRTGNFKFVNYVTSQVILMI